MEDGLMGEEEKIRQLLYRFAYGGLVEKSSESVVSCISGRILGIGMGEQGFVTSIRDVEKVMTEGKKEGDTAVHTLDFGRVEIRLMEENFGVVCADIHVNSHSSTDSERTIHSQFQQSLTVVKEQGEWKICGLHASAPEITEESMEAYPLKFAEKTLINLREKIGEAVYLAEEQYRRAVLADTIAFYIINFTKDQFEKCQLQGDLCVQVDFGTPYDNFVRTQVPAYVYEEDQALFLGNLSLKNIEKAFLDGSNEVSCEYRMICPDGTKIWTKTIIRLITDIASGDRKGIMYVKNIDSDKRSAQAIQEKANLDGMTMVLNKAAMIREVNCHLEASDESQMAVFLMIDADDFKKVNDTFGHPVGDLVLIRISENLKQIFSANAVIGRLGGDEFGVFLPDCRIKREIEICCRRLTESVHQMCLEQAPGLRTSVSVGGVQRRLVDFDSYYRAADDVLYQVKRAGKDNVRID